MVFKENEGTDKDLGQTNKRNKETFSEVMKLTTSSLSAKFLKSYHVCRPPQSAHDNVLTMVQFLFINGTVVMGFQICSVRLIRSCTAP